ALGACAHRQAASEPQGRPSRDFQPLAVGNEWTYTGRMMGQPVERTLRLVAVEDGYYVYDDEGRSRLKHDDLGLRDEKRYLLQHPVEKGRSWSSIVSVSSTERYEIVDTGFNCQSPAGRFTDCVKVRATNRIDPQRQFRMEWTYAPGVGQVRLSFAVLEGDRELPQGELELQRYQVQPRP
ncbi:MAG: hypothetical protein ACK4N5_12550, partial [Myxococcales bacterium]